MSLGAFTGGDGLGGSGRAAFAIGPGDGRRARKHTTWVVRSAPVPLYEIVACIVCRREMAYEALLAHVCPPEELSEWDKWQLARGPGELFHARAAAAALETQAAAKAAREAASAEKYATERGLFTMEDKLAYVSASGVERGAGGARRVVQRRTSEAEANSPRDTRRSP